MVDQKWCHYITNDWRSIIGKAGITKHITILMSETWGCILKFRFNMFYFVFTFRINTELFGGRQQRQENSEKKLHWSQIFFVKFWGHACPAQDMHRIPRFVTFIFYFNIAYNPSMGQMRQCSENFREFLF